MKRNCHNSRTSDDIDMKLGPVTKPDTKQRQKKKDVIAIFSIYGQLQQSGNRIPDAQSVKLLFYKRENRTKNSLTQLHTIALSKGTVLAKKR